MMTITYAGRNGIYVNLTNRCPCACTFCLRQNRDKVFNSDSLWLEREPTVKEICDSIDTWDLAKYEEIVFCGYGEPTERLEDLLKVAEYIKSKNSMQGAPIFPAPPIFPPRHIWQKTKPSPCRRIICGVRGIITRVTFTSKTKRISSARRDTTAVPLPNRSENSFPPSGAGPIGTIPNGSSIPAIRTGTTGE